MIYLIRAKQIKLCKIGYSKSPIHRFRQLQTATPYVLELTCIINGEISDERKLHTRYKAQHVIREWFKYTPSIGAYFKRKKENEKVKPKVAKRKS